MTKLLAITVVFLSFEHSAQATALSLREPLDRDNGNIEQIAGEYHGGTDRKNWGPRTKSYIARVVNDKNDINKPTRLEKTTFEKELAKQTSQTATPSISSIYDAYQSGKMSAQDTAEFEADVKNGLIALPKGATLKNNSQENLRSCLEIN